MTIDAPMSEQRPGVWVVYDYEVGPYARTVYGSELDALRHANHDGYGHVCYWPYGEDLSAAIDGRGTRMAGSVSTVSTNERERGGSEYSRTPLGERESTP